MSEEQTQAEELVAEAGASAPHAAGHHGPHISSRFLLLGVVGALLVLTVLTVGVTAVDLGSQGNFIVAMIIATVKAALVMLFFMHLAWDKKFNVVVFTSSFLFVMLFLAMALLDRQEYQQKIDSFAYDKASEAS